MFITDIQLLLENFPVQVGRSDGFGCGFWWPVEFGSKLMPRHLADIHHFGVALAVDGYLVCHATFRFPEITLIMCGLIVVKA